MSTILALLHYEIQASAKGVETRNIDKGVDYLRGDLNYR
jgi:hypothetical protein